MNYGAIATSEALRTLISGQGDIAVKYIDARSYRKMTPEEGWPESVEEHIERVKERHNAAESKKVDVVQQKVYDSDWRKRYIAPIRYDEYEKYAETVKQGKIFPYEKKMLEWADIVIVNGEGSIVHGTDRYGVYRMSGLYILFMLYLAKEAFHKETYIINHTVDPDNMEAKEIIQNIYPFLDGVYVREKFSLDVLHQSGIRNAELVPDALFSYNFQKNRCEIPEFLKEQIDFDKPYICLGDSSGIRNNFNTINWNVENVYESLIEKLKEKFGQVILVDGFGGSHNALNAAADKCCIPSVNIWNCSFEQLYRVLEGADIFISGRWHASIISLMSHTPILLWGADSHKTKGLYNIIDYPYKFFDIKSIPINIDRIAEEADSIVNDDLSHIYKKVDDLSVKAGDNIKMLRFIKK